MPNDAYQRRLAEWEKKERERKAAMGEPPSPYDPDQMESRVPLGCTMLVITGIMVLAYLIYRYFKIHGWS
jgi:hypothetical protein